jgi:hypothetical protein
VEGVFAAVDPRVIVALGAVILLVVIGLIVVTSWLDSRRSGDAEDKEE